MYQYTTLILCILLVAVYIRPLGAYMTAVYRGLPHLLSRPLGFLERGLYRACGINPKIEMSWLHYAYAVLSLGGLSFILLFILFLGQGVLPLNPQNMEGLSVHTAFNAAISFVTNTNWQSYSGETALSYFSQTVGLTVQMFLSAATGMAIAVALSRSIASRQEATIGNFWVDCVRTVVYILLPLAFFFSLILVSQGVVQTYSDYIAYTSLEGQKGLIATGPVAFQTAIKMLGSNGGGFFGANAAHPFENPNAVSNLLQTIAILLIPAAFAYTAGMLMRDRRQGWMMLAAMSIIFFPLLAFNICQEWHVTPKFDAQFIDTRVGNMEGKETRFGITNSALWASATTATSNGSANASHDSFTPLGGLVPLLLIQLGETVFGGVGSGLYGVMIYVLLAVFIAGLMVGRTPEFMGKKLTPFDIKMAMLGMLIPSVLVLVGTAVAVMIEAGRVGITNPGAQGFSEILYAFSSASNNNGSAFGGLQANSNFYDYALGICMLIGRYGVILPILAIAGSMASKNIVPNSAGTLPTHSLLFTVLLVMVILVLGILTYVPSLALGPVAEHIHVWGAL